MNVPCPNSDCRVVLFESFESVSEPCPACDTFAPEDFEQEFAVRANHPQAKDPLLLNSASQGQADLLAGQINDDSTPATAEVVSRPKVGWST